MTERQWVGICKFSKELKAAYVLQRRTLRGKYNLDTGTWNERFWFEAARKLDADRVTEASSYVDVQFQRTKPTVCMPNQLLGATALEYYRRITGPRARLNDAEMVVQWHKDIVAGQIKHGVRVDEFLDHPNVPINALFAYCLAHSEKLDDLAKRYEAGAREFLSAYPHYCQTTLGPFIPKELLVNVGITTTA